MNGEKVFTELQRENTSGVVSHLLDKIEAEIESIKCGALSSDKARMVLQGRRTQMRGVENVLSSKRLKLETERIQREVKRRKR
jgi:hypothetical protein